MTKERKILGIFNFDTNRREITTNTSYVKVEKILKGSLDLIPSPSPLVKIQIMWGSCKGKTLLGVVNKLFVFKSMLTTPSNVSSLHLKQIFPPIIWIFTKGEGDGIESRLPLKIFSTLTSAPSNCVTWRSYKTLF